MPVPRVRVVPAASPRRAAHALVLVAATLAFLAPATATAIAPTPEAPLAAERHHMTLLRAKVADAVLAIEAGDRARAARLARSAAEDDLPKVEGSLALRNPGLVDDVELSLRDLSDDIEAGALPSAVRAGAAELRGVLDDIDAELDPAGLASPTLAFGLSFSILLREGVEAVLLLAVLASALAAGQSGTGHRRPLGLGALAALAMTGVTWLVTTLVIDLAPVSRELLEAITALTAVAVLAGVSLWLVVGRLHQRRWLEFMPARTTAAIAAGSAGAFAALGFAAVYREGFETVLLYQALALLAPGQGVAILLGLLAAIVALAVIGYAILGLGRRVPVKVMLAGGAATLALLSVAFVGNAVRCLQEANVLAADPIRQGWARLPVLAAELTGVHPTVQGVGAQAGLLALYGLGAAWLLRRGPLRRLGVRRVAAG